MTKHIIFIQVQERPGIIEAEVIEDATIGELRKAINDRRAPAIGEVHLYFTTDQPL